MGHPSSAGTNGLGITEVGALKFRFSWKHDLNLDAPLNPLIAEIFEDTGHRIGSLQPVVTKTVAARPFQHYLAEAPLLSHAPCIGGSSFAKFEAADIFKEPLHAMTEALLLFSAVSPN